MITAHTILPLSLSLLANHGIYFGLAEETLRQEALQFGMAEEPLQKVSQVSRLLSNSWLGNYS